jgi:PII-like signaling protein
VNEDCLKLTVYLGETARCDGRLVSDALLDRFERAGVHAAVLLRGAEGFGGGGRLHTQRLLTLSEELPLVAVAVDTRERVEALVPDVRALVTRGLVTLERARLLTGSLGPERLPAELHDAAKLTLYLGRAERAGGRLAYLAAVDALRRHGVAGATVFLGVDGMADGERRRAAFLSANRDVPMMVVAVGSGESIAAALPELGELLDRPLATLERVRVCKRDGRLLAEPALDVEPSEVRQKLMVFAGEQARHDGHPLYVELLRRLRQAGAAGATALRGVWGYSGDHAPHGDRALAWRRRVPMVTVLIDRPERMRRSFELVDELTDETGLVTSELVPAYDARASTAE